MSVKLKVNRGNFSLSAFTLAEVLITLGIIGIVAAMTIPTLLNKAQEMQFKTAYKKAFATLSEAWRMASANGDITACDNWGDWSGGTCNADNFKALKKYLKVSKDCGTNTADCWDMSGEKAWVAWGNSLPSNNALSFIDASGIAWAKNQAQPAAEVLFDVNGFKEPNKYGKDRFVVETLYYSYSLPNSFNASEAKVKYFSDFPSSDPSVIAYYPDKEQQSRCPSIASDSTYHCYYTSWITGEK